MSRVFIATPEGAKPALALFRSGQWAVTRRDELNCTCYGATHLPTGFCAMSWPLPQALRVVKALGSTAPAFDFSTYSDELAAQLKGIVRAVVHG
jgi:hypothetical protein